MKWVKRIFKGLVILLIAGFLHYFLPSRDIVQIVGTDVKRMDIGNKPWFWDKTDAGTETHSTRDVRFINAIWPGGKSRVYRNEDTNWSFPPYFKFDSGNLSAEAQGLAKQEGTVWVAVSHYGWRVKLLSMFPNAYRVKRVESPDALLIPWFNIAFLSLITVLWLSAYLSLKKFKAKRVDPITDKISEVAESAGEEALKKKSAIGKFFRRWFGTTKE